MERLPEKYTNRSGSSNSTKKAMRHFLLNPIVFEIIAQMSPIDPHVEAEKAKREYLENGASTEKLSHFIFVLELRKESIHVVSDPLFGIGHITFLR